MDGNDGLKELIESAASYSGKLYHGLEKIVEGLRGNKTKDALNSLAEATEGIEWLIQAIMGLNASGEECGGFETEGMSRFLAEMVEAAENMDYVLLADLIEYEILPIIEVWGNRLDDILELNTEDE